MEASEEDRKIADILTRPHEMYLLWLVRKRVCHSVSSLKQNIEFDDESELALRFLVDGGFLEARENSLFLTKMGRRAVDYMVSTAAPNFTLPERLYLSIARMYYRLNQWFSDLVHVLDDHALTIGFAFVVLLVFWILYQIMRPSFLEGIVLVIASVVITLMIAAIVYLLLMLAFRSGRLDISGCLAGDVSIDTPSGPRRLADLRPGDLVWSWDEHARVQVASSIGLVSHHPNLEIFRLMIAFDGEIVSISTTKHHSFLATSGWSPCWSLRPGDRVLRLSRGGDLVEGEVHSIIETGTSEPVYNLRLEGRDTFFCEGIPVHSFTYLRKIRSNLHKRTSKKSLA